MAGSSYWDLLDSARAHGKGTLRVPILTAALVIACIAVFYACGEYDDQGTCALAMTYKPKKQAEWWRSLSAMFSHVGTAHLWTNVAILGLSGGFFEFTEGIIRTACVVWGSCTLGFAMHGALTPDNWVRGISGVNYGLIFAQASLLALNWAEMPWRIPRALLLLVLLGGDIGLFAIAKQDGTSYAAHLFGGLAGVLIALNLGRNVVVLSWELVLSLLGLIGYIALIAVALGFGQTSPGGLATAVLIPMLIHSFALVFAKPSPKSKTGTKEVTVMSDIALAAP